MKTPREIAIIAAPRSGTNFFCDTLGEFAGNAALLEIFSPEGVFGVNKYDGLLAGVNKRLGTSFDDPMDKSFVAAVRRQPIEFLAALKETVKDIGLTSVSYKLFANQITRDNVKALLQDPDRAIVFVVRSRLDSYISFCKAKARDVWVNQDTSDLKVEIKVDEFLSWAKELDAWYAYTESILREQNRQYCVFSYDSDINVPKAKLVEKQFLGLRGLGVDLAYPRDVGRPLFTRQDKPTGPFGKIENGESLRQELIDRQLLGTYAVRNPMVPKP